MKSPVLIIGDPHLHVFKQYAVTTEAGENSRLADIYRALLEAIGVGTRMECKVAVIPGDLFHVRGNMKPSILNAWLNLMQCFAGSGMQVVIVPGNHDMENYKGGATAVDALEVMPGVHVLRDPDTVLNLSGWNIAGLGYRHTLEDFQQDFLKLPHADLVVMHQGVDSLKPDAGLPDWGLTYEWLEANHPGFIVAGHYHRAALKGRVLVPGSPTQQSHADEGHEHGCWVLEYNSTPQFFPLSAPEFTTIREAKGITEKAVKGRYVRLITDSKKKALEWREKAEELGALGVTAKVEKSFKAAHEKGIKMSTPRQMAVEYFDLHPEKFGARRSQIEAALDEVMGEVCATV